MCYYTFNVQTAFVAASTECQPDIDGELGLQWQLTSAGSVAEQQCPNRSGNMQILQKIQIFVYSGILMINVITYSDLNFSEIVLLK